VTNSLGVAQHTSSINRQCLLILRNNLLANELLLAVHAAEGLTEVGYACEVINSLSSRAVTALDMRKRCLIARELVRAGRIEKLSVLREALVNGDDACRVTAAESLFKVRQTIDPVEIRHVLDGTSSMPLQLMIFAVLSINGDLDALDRIRERLLVRSRDARRVTAWILARLGTPEDVISLRNATRTESEPVVRAYPDHALAALNDQDGLRSLKANLRSKCVDIRRMAAETCRLLPPRYIASELMMLLADRDSDVQVRAAHALLCVNRPHVFLGKVAKNSTPQGGIR